MSGGRRELCGQFFAELDAQGIPYAILDGAGPVPGPVGADIDYAVRDADLARAVALLGRTARAHGWVVVQAIQHEARAHYMRVANPDEPGDRLELDVRSHFTVGARLLVRDSMLLRGRARRPDGYVTVSPDAECVYLLAKSVGGIATLDDSLPRLRELEAAAPEACEERFQEVFGSTGRPLRAWLSDIDPNVGDLRRVLHRRRPMRSSLLLHEVRRLARRAASPPGLHLSILGPDGVGKTTLIDDVGRTLGPLFAGWQVIKFRPDLLNRIGVPSDPEPHSRAPRSLPVSWAKVLFYFGDSWLGYVLIVRPALARNRCVVFDRDFEDLVVDQRRYLVRGSSLLARVLRRVAPHATVTVILDADATVIHDRKPELAMEEIEHQSAEYRRLAKSAGRYRVIAADRPRDVIAEQVGREILMVLAMRHYRLGRIKRVFDMAGALTMIVVLSPVILSVATLVRVRLGSPVLFRQQRPGLGGRSFTIYKFRTMKNALLPNGRMRPDAERMTPLGATLRRLSLDELPELFNVVKGDMSLVGPRPLLLEYLPRYTLQQMRRHDVRPGITGWAQINGRNGADWPERFKLDLWYIDHRSLLLDVRILLRTVAKVIRREGVALAGSGAESRFQGVEPGEERPS